MSFPPPRKDMPCPSGHMHNIAMVQGSSLQHVYISSPTSKDMPCPSGHMHNIAMVQGIISSACVHIIPYPAKDMR
ncbi:hypothetical protein AMTR_s00200p00015800 [Amborella trichopoda]|uniref:Uncharacterized protein n=1 Tax=Amborella trichopoda TaxID=13333 RepID=W1NRB4_AMBTC|nr:hypothetical protein AMTR_s00200p00015800 [Amborella trichopoda]